MKIKLFAIGNKIMGDDSLPIYVVEKLKKYFVCMGIKVIIGETDFQYCLSEVEDGDYIIILDSTFFQIEPGSITVSSLKDINKINYNNSLLSQHSYSLISNLESFYKTVTCTVIGIEGINFDYSLTMSTAIEERMDYILSEVKEAVVRLLRKSN